MLTASCIASGKRMSLPSARLTFLLVVIASSALIAFALYLQHRIGLDPCPLCISQRIAVMAVGITALIACLHNPGRTGQRIWAGIMGLCALAGAGLAARHVWIQHLPPEKVPACGPGLEYLFDVFPWQEVLIMLLQGDGNCAEVSWTWLGLSIPAWTLIAFAGFLLASGWAFFANKR